MAGWLREHDELAHRIALSGQRFACAHLTRPGRLCYWARAIRDYASLVDYAPSLARRPRAFPLDRLNIMCRVGDAPNVCYYNILYTVARPLPAGYECEKPVPDVSGAFEECWYRGARAAAG